MKIPPELIQKLSSITLSDVNGKVTADSFPVCFGWAFVWMQAEDKLAGERASGRAYPGVGTSSPARLLNPQLIYICLFGFFLNLFTKKLKSAWVRDTAPISC